MPIRELSTPHPLIDADPHFARVVQYMRPSDYAWWGGATAAMPFGLYFMEQVDSTRSPRGIGSALRLATFLGACGGFLFAYQRSSFRLWGWAENSLELERAKSDEKPYGTDPSKSSLDSHLQSVAHRNSAFSQLKFSTIPWFNVVAHPFHGNGSQEKSE
ncbi:hypothetical protein IE81DRAFT_136246 [Ceraceosorus guamensis]|uniref:NADH-ubiquinone oxidoreductase 21 kDa subunit n=1 Tax=Ceraceosorus guamensis TaxID=1522189 RepID=A0A316VXR2_9BASI|nr:hypothetical protein IE81DRAFT_136246 [Ceraceosorus guamensis]PWN42416.1 hypothetical protein IE81DRAFT_136246 [Ceraceosorus guamensis]